MPLAPGHRLGSYQIVNTLGAGGMGEVYRARDTALGRDVAIKVLPDLFAKDPERMARLTREARALAALSHPNIANVHGLDDSGSGPALVMELVEGEDLADRIARGPVPPAEAIPIARQIAEALEAAHEHGIVHRDLKPANIRIRPDGTVKVLDFGLAKAVGPASLGAGRGDAESATFTAGPSEQGVVLGSAAYMAPEQARGRPVDKRADIWAFGAVLYEMVTGTRAFRGDGFSDILAAVLRSEIDWSRLPAGTPARLRHLLERCLTSDVRQRLRDIGEARVALAAIERTPEDRPVTAAAVASRQVAWRERFAWAAAALAVVAAVFFATRFVNSEPPTSPDRVTRLSVLPPPGLRLNPDSANVVISPDGRFVALVVGGGISAENQLWVRPLDSPVARRIESGDGVSLPFWSPDSSKIGFFAGRKLKVVDAAGGPAVVICNADFPRGGTWNRSNVIVFAPDAQGALYRVAASGGTPAPVTRLDKPRHGGHRFPYFLPDGERFLYAAIPGGENGFDILVDSLNGGATVSLGRLGSAPVYADPGWLLFARQGVLTAQRFDPRSLKMTGEPVSLGDQPGIAPSPAAYEAGPRVSAAANGSLAYFLPVPADTSVHWIDKSGRVLRRLDVPPGRYTNVSLAPDDARAIFVRDDPSGTSSLWLIDLPRAGAVPLVTEGRNKAPVWSPDGKTVLFASQRGGEYGFFKKVVADTAPEVRIARFNDQSAEPRGWTNDGAWIIFNRVDPATRWNIYRFPADRPDAPEVIVNGPSVEVGGRPSPDNRWIAYLSDETGRLDVFMHRFAASGPKLQVSTGGVQTGWWARDGRELLWLRRDQSLWRMPIDLKGEAPRLGAAEQVGTFPPGVVTMDLTRDGQFLAIVAERAEGGAVTVVQSWRSALPEPR